ncbi:MAG TPA: cation:proton antiporter [Solirubrobacteraceae bacterium]|jgi:NhaP-type Na+/H+ or K+/H+ antiporter|nr:cation:proton antiporter [Solirubrobacteraceae bacterium]
MTSLQTATGVFGGLLILGALLSGLAHRGTLSLAAVFVLAGFLLGDGGTGLIHLRPDSGFLADLTTVALIVLLFRDGIEVDAELIQREWRAPLRKLLIGMPITAAIVALATHTIVGLSWAQSFLLGALLSPTDPVLSSGVVTDPRVPRIVRHSLNLESGLNDGLALAGVVALAAVVDTHSQHFVWWHFALQDIGLGFAFGIVCGLVGSLLLPRATTERIPGVQKTLYGLGVAFATYSVTVLPPGGNGLIAVFVAAIILGARRPDLRDHFVAGAGEVIEIVKLGVFTVFASLLTIDGLTTDGWGAVAVVLLTLLVARPAAIWAALAGTPLDPAAKAFMAWFGPKGVATMAFALLILGRRLPGGQQIFDIAALTVVASVVLHGLTENRGIAWLRDHRPPP